MIADRQLLFNAGIASKLVTIVSNLASDSTVLLSAVIMLNDIMDTSTEISELKPILSKPFIARVAHCLKHNTNFVIQTQSISFLHKVCVCKPEWEREIVVKMSVFKSILKV